MLNQKPEPDWDLIIEGQSSLFDLKLKDIWAYRDLIVMLVNRDFVNFSLVSIKKC